MATKDSQASPITFRIDADTKARIKALGEREGMNFSEVVQAAIKEFLADQKAASYLVSFVTDDGYQHIELSADKVNSSPIELVINIRNGLREEEDDPSFNPTYCQPISIWEFEKPHDDGGTYIVFTKSADTRGALSFLPLQVTSAKPISSLKQLLELLIEPEDQNMIMVTAITGVHKVKK